MRNLIRVIAPALALCLVGQAVPAADNFARRSWKTPRSSHRCTQDGKSAPLAIR